MASHHSLSPIRICRVKGHEQANVKRSLIEFSRNVKDIKMEQLTIEHSRHEYTDEYIDLVRDFYLIM
jgi:tRNA1Val (adenine37-N6)-methyltransferase